MEPLDLDLKSFSVYWHTDEEMQKSLRVWSAVVGTKHALFLIGAFEMPQEWANRLSPGQMEKDTRWATMGKTSMKNEPIWLKKAEVKGFEVIVAHVGGQQHGEKDKEKIEKRKKEVLQFALGAIKDAKDQHTKSLMNDVSERLEYDLHKEEELQQKDERLIDKQQQLFDKEKELQQDKEDFQVLRKKQQQLQQERQQFLQWQEEQYTQMKLFHETQKQSFAQLQQEKEQFQQEKEQIRQLFAPLQQGKEQIDKQEKDRFQQQQEQLQQSHNCQKQLSVLLLQKQQEVAAGEGRVAAGKRQFPAGKGPVPEAQAAVEATGGAGKLVFGPQFPGTAGSHSIPDNSRGLAWQVDQLRGHVLVPVLLRSRPIGQ